MIHIYAEDQVRFNTILGREYPLAAGRSKLGLAQDYINSLSEVSIEF